MTGRDEVPQMVWVKLCALTIEDKYHRSMRLTLPDADRILISSPFVP